MLSDVQASAATAGEKDYKLADANGLYLFVTRSGFKSWRMKYRFAGKEKRLTFGPYPEVSLEEARARRDEARGLLRDQIDPSAERQRRRGGGARTAAEPMSDVGDESDDADDADEVAVTAPTTIVAPVAPVASAVPAMVAARPELAEDEPPDVAPFAPQLVVGSRALSLLKQAESAADAAARQSRRAARLGYLAIGLILIGALALALWLLAGQRHAGASIHAAAPSAGAVQASTAQGAPSVAVPAPVPPAPVQPMATTPLPAMQQAGPATTVPAPAIRAAAAPRRVPRGHRHRRRHARHRTHAPNAARLTEQGAAARPLSQETSHDIRITAPGAQAIDPALDRAGRAALCLRAAYSADPGCAAVRAAGGLVGAAEADAAGGAPRQ